MKITVLSICIGLCTYAAHGQTNHFPATGKVGIGTNTPEVLLDIAAPAEYNLQENLMKFSVKDSDGQSFQIKNATSINGSFIPSLVGTRNKSDNHSLGITGVVSDATVDVGEKPIVRFDARIATGPTVVRPLFLWGSYTNDYMIMTANGNLGVGTNKPTQKLSVKGKIRAQEIIVEASNWPDYVFKPEYILPSLADTERFIQQHGHLPEVPNAKEAEDNGISLGEMNKILLKKVEELTLHLIEKEKLLNKVIQRLEIQEAKN